jgi:hypothetical protein
MYWNLSVVNLYRSNQYEYISVHIVHPEIPYNLQCRTRIRIIANYRVVCSRDRISNISHFPTKNNAIWGVVRG